MNREADSSRFKTCRQGLAKKKPCPVERAMGLLQGNTQLTSKKSQVPTKLLSWPALFQWNARNASGTSNVADIFLLLRKKRYMRPSRL